MAQKDDPHQHNIDVGPQGLVMVDFIDLKDSQGDISRNQGSKTGSGCAPGILSLSPQVGTQGPCLSLPLCILTSNIPSTINCLLIHPSVTFPGPSSSYHLPLQWPSETSHFWAHSPQLGVEPGPENSLPVTSP